MSTRLLYQFPISHFCEKARWNLDYKGLDFEVHNLLPGPHMVQAKRLSGTNTVPILREDGRCISDSSAIALHLEAACPEPRLLPVDQATRERVLAEEERYDRLGEEVRRWIYGYLVYAPAFRRVFYAGYEAPKRWLGYAMAPALRRILPRAYRIRPDTVERSRMRLLDGLAQLETDLGQDPARYIVGASFTLADLTAAALYAPLIGPPESPWTGVEGMPPEYLAMREQLRARVAGQWVLRIYREHRVGKGLVGHAES
jgi:glutathione S-transferase